MRDVPGARPLTAALILGGVSVLAYMQSNLTALLVEGVIGDVWRRRRMQGEIGKLKGHIVVAGAGNTGKHVVEELVATRATFVVIDRNEHTLRQLSNDLCAGKMLYVHGDATIDGVLLSAGVDRARGVVAALTHDKDNLYVTLSARSLNAQARIVSKVVEDEAAPKILKAGASSIVNPTMIGARRLAGELIRPEVHEFLDQMLRDKDKNLRLGGGGRRAGIGLRGPRALQGHADPARDARARRRRARPRPRLPVQPGARPRDRRGHDAHRPGRDREHRQAAEPRRAGVTSFCCHPEGPRPKEPTRPWGGPSLRS